MSADTHDSLAILAKLNRRMRYLLDQADRDLRAGRIDATTHRDYHRKAAALEAQHRRILSVVASLTNDRETRH